MKNKHFFKEGDEVTIENNRGGYETIPLGTNGTVVHDRWLSSDLARVNFGPKHGIRTVFQHRLAPLKKAAPVQPTAKMTAAVLDLLKSKGSLTALEAQGVLRCRSLSKRISELKRLGWSISRELKEDTTGQRYARYSLTT